MQIQLIRSATLKFTFAGQTLLIDPWFAKTGQGNSYAGTETSPLVDLPMSIDQILRGVDAVVVSHLHSDHWDDVAQNAIEADTPVLCHSRDAAEIRAQGFRNVLPLTGRTDFNGVSIQVTDGQHGPPEILAEMGSVSGFMFRAPQEPTLYWAGDTILCDDVRGFIERESPDVIVVHACGAIWNGVEPLVMDVSMTLETVRMSAPATVIATHLDAVDHATVTRSDLLRARDLCLDATNRLLIPSDGEIVTLNL